MQGYYDEGPILTLDRHLALAGLVVVDTSRIAHHLSALTGLPLLDLDRRIEHEAGKSVWEIVLEDGPAAYRDFESQELERALADRPYGVLALGDSTLLDADHRSRLAAETTLVALDRDLANCYWRFQTLQQEKSRTAWHPLYPDPLQSLDQVRPFFQDRQPALAVARHTIALAGRHVNSVAQSLVRYVMESGDPGQATSAPPTVAASEPDQST